MAYQVIARKYRPQRFADVVGQEHVTQTLANAIQQNRIAHAYLFVGPRGTGKTTIARIFSMCLNCTGGPKVEFAPDDPRCLEISEGRSLDVLEIDGASNRGIEEIRALRETVKYAPANGKYKIYIIDEVHMLTKEAFNALLKTLEEPPEHVKFMFATTEPEKVLPTILSRCQRYDLRRIPVGRIARHLAFIAREEAVTADEAALLAIARGAEGCMRDAESTLDQLISFCGNQIQESDVLSMFGLAARGQIQGLAGILLDGNADAALRTLHELETNGKDLSRLLSDLLEHFRNLLLYLIGHGDLRLLEVTETEGAILKQQAALADIETLTRVMETLADGENRLRDAVSKKIFVEVTLLKAIQARHAVSIDTILKQLAQLRQGGAPAKAALDTAAAATPSPAPAPARATERRPVSPAPASVATVPPPAKPEVASTTLPTPVSPSPLPRETAPAPIMATAAPTPPGDLGAMWAKIVEAVGQTSQFTRTYLLQAHPISLVKQVLTIGFSAENADHIDLVDNPKNRNLIQTKIRDLGWGDAQIKFIKSEPPPAPQGSLFPEIKPAPAPAVSPIPAPTAPAKAPEPAAKPVKGPVEKKEPEKPANKPPTVVLSKEDFKNDPLIKQALEIFKGQILEVRGPNQP